MWSDLIFATQQGHLRCILPGLSAPWEWMIASYYSPFCTSKSLFAAFLIQPPPVNTCSLFCLQPLHSLAPHSFIWCIFVKVVNCWSYFKKRSEWSKWNGHTFPHFFQFRSFISIRIYFLASCRLSLVSLTTFFTFLFFLHLPLGQLICSCSRLHWSRQHWVAVAAAGGEVREFADYSLSCRSQHCTAAAQVREGTGYCLVYY